jgi:hypothetical protein
MDIGLVTSCFTSNIIRLILLFMQDIEGENWYADHIWTPNVFIGNTNFYLHQRKIHKSTVFDIQDYVLLYNMYIVQ